VSPLSFFQVNTPAAAVLYTQIGALAELTPDDLLLDIHIPLRHQERQRERQRDREREGNECMCVCERERERKRGTVCVRTYRNAHYAFVYVYGVCTCLYLCACVRCVRCGTRRGRRSCGHWSVALNCTKGGVYVFSMGPALTALCTLVLWDGDDRAVSGGPGRTGGRAGAAGGGRA
jgi:hypothetical protein